MPTYRSVLLALSLCLAGAVLAPGTALARQAPKKERDLITRQELVEAAAKFPDLYQAVRRLRSHFLATNRGTRSLDIQPGAPGAPMCDGDRAGCVPRAQGNTPAPLPVVYLDGGKFGEPELLKNLLTADIEEVRYMSANQAGMEFGLGHEGGAILVKRYKGEKPPPF